jgi:riboflavin synthase
MFTGIITGIGTVTEAKLSPDVDLTLWVESDGSPDDIVIGASIAHAGVCLTVIETSAPLPGRVAWLVQASSETCGLTTAKHWDVGTKLNLERALRVGDELGGHLVSGHVDGIAALILLEQNADSHQLVFEAPTDLARFIAKKGSVCLDGVSLTVNEVEGNRFGVNIIAHTWAVTTLGQLTVGSVVNLEIDTVARYMARYLETIPTSA